MADGALLLSGDQNLSRIRPRGNRSPPVTGMARRETAALPPARRMALSGTALEKTRPGRIFKTAGAQFDSNIVVV